MNSTTEFNEIAGEEIMEEQPSSSITAEIVADLDHQQTGIDTTDVTTTGTAEDSTMESKETNTIDESGTSVEANQSQPEDFQNLLKETALKVLSNQAHNHTNDLLKTESTMLNVQTDDEFLASIPNFEREEALTLRPFLRIFQLSNEKRYYALQLLEERFKKLKLSKTHFNAILRDAKSYKKAQKNAPKANMIEFADLEDSPQLATEIYEIIDAGIYRDGRLISTTPIIPLKVTINKDTNKIKVLVAIKVAGKWIKIVVPKRFLLSANLLTRLADTGLDVSTMNSHELVDCMNNILRINRDKIPVEYMSSSCGWNTTFTEFVPIIGKTLVDDGDGENSIANFIKAQGDKTATVDFYKKMLNENLPLRIMVAAALASVVLAPLNLLPFFLNTFGTSGTGKTLGMKFVAALFGNPRMGGFLRSLNGTINALLRLAASMKNLPVILDEVELIRNAHGYRKMIMTIAAGLDRARLTGDITQAQQRNWCCSFLTTGESSLIRETDEAGVSNRVIEMEISKDFPVIANINDGPEIAAFLNKNYGFLGPMFLNVVIDLIKNDELKTIFTRYFNEVISHHDTTTKIANNLAAILTADFILYHYIFKEDVLDAKDVEFLVTPKEKISSTIPAMEFVINYIYSNSAKFNLVNEVNPEESHKATGSRLGTIRITKDMCNVSFLKSKLQPVLASAGFSFESLKHAWAESGFLIKHDNRRYTHPDTIDGQSVYVVKFAYSLAKSEEEDK